MLENLKNFLKNIFAGRKKKEEEEEEIQPPKFDLKQYAQIRSQEMQPFGKIVSAPIEIGKEAMSSAKQFGLGVASNLADFLEGIAKATAVKQAADQGIMQSFIDPSFTPEKYGEKIAKSQESPTVKGVVNLKKAIESDKPKTTVQKISRVAGYLTPEFIGVAKGGSALAKQKPIQLAQKGIEKLAEKIGLEKAAGRALMGVSTGLPYSLSATGLTTLREISKGDEDFRLGEELAQNIALDVGTSALPYVGPFFAGVEKARFIKDPDELASAVAKEFNKKAGDELTDNVQNIVNELVKKGYRISDDLLEKMSKGEAFSGTEFGFFPEKPFGEFKGKITFIFDEGFKPKKIQETVEKVAPKIEREATERVLTEPKIKPPEPPKTKEIPKELYPFMEEAKKYKKADDFVESLISEKKVIPEEFLESVNIDDLYSYLHKITRSPKQPDFKVRSTPEPEPELEPELKFPIVRKETTEAIVPTREIEPPEPPRREFIAGEQGVSVLPPERTQVLWRESLEEMAERSPALKERIDRIIQEADDIRKIGDEMLRAKEDELWVNRVPVLNDFFKKVAESEKYRRLTATEFTDPVLDRAYKRGLLGLVFSIRNRVAREYRLASQKAKEVVGRRLTSEELGAVLRQELERVAKLQDKGATKIKIGKDILAPEIREKLYKVFEPVMDELSAGVVAYQSMIDDWVKSGYIKPEDAKKLWLTETKEFIKNLGKYLRTVYDNPLIYRREFSLYEPAVYEFMIKNPSLKRKITDYEWGAGYLKALQEGDIPLTKEVVPEHLIEAVQTNDKRAIEELGRYVKESSGWIYDGEQALRKTMNYISNNIFNAFLSQSLINRDDVVSRVPKEGFIKVKDKGLGILNGLYVRKDVLEEIKAMHEFRKAIPDLLQTYTSAWKLSTVAMRPAAWARNLFYGLVAQQTMAGNSPLNPVNLANFVKAAKDFTEYYSGKVVSKELDQFLRYGGGGGDLPSEEVVSVFRELHEGLAKKVDQNKLVSLFVNALKKLEKVSEGYSIIDGFNKYALFLNRIKKGVDPAKAILDTNFYINNYALNPKWAREFARSWASVFVPFISFHIANVPVVLKTAIQNPHRIAMLMALPLILKTAFILRYPEAAQEAELTRPYYQQHNPFFVPLGIDDRGRVLWIDMAYLLNLPVRTDAKEMFWATAEWLLQPAIFSGGIISGVGQAITGTDIWGRELDERQRLEAFLTSLPFGLLSKEVLDIYKALEGMPHSPSGRVREVSDALLRTFLGVPLNRFGVEQIRANVSKELMELNEEKGKLNKILQNPDASQEEKERQIRRYNEKLIEASRKIAEFLGKTKKETTQTKPTPLTDKTTTETIRLPLITSKEGDLVQKVAGVAGGGNIKLKAPRIKLETPAIRLPKVSANGRKRKAVSIKITPPPKPTLKIKKPEEKKRTVKLKVKRK